jgi:hypothetical protein
LTNSQLQHIDSTEETPEIKRISFFKKYWPRLPTQIIPSLRNKFSQLTLSQWMYLIAFLLLLVHVEQDVEQDYELWWVGAIAGIGLVRELWHVFNRVWEHMLGKALILVLYAATANFALAISALKINVITGIEPGPFIFTLGFATLIMLPFWLLISSIMFFSVALVAGNLWLVIGLLLRLVRVKIKVHWEDKSFVLITMILRLVLIPYVIMSIFFMAVPYAKQIELFEQPIALFKKSVADNKDEKDEKEALKALNDNIEINETDNKNITIRLNQRPFSIPVDDDGHIKWLDKVIAGFIYYFETYPKSACKKSPLQRSLPIDENLILLVTEDYSDIGYQFTVGPCVGNYSDIESQVQN